MHISQEEVLDLDSEDSDDEEIRNLKAQLRRVKQEQRKYEYADDIEEQSEEEDDTEKGLCESVLKLYKHVQIQNQMY